MKISIKKIIKEKSPSLYKKIPNFVIWLLSKLLCENSINKLLAASPNLDGAAFIKSSLDYLKIDRVCVGLEDLDGDKAYVFASNHPLGGLDGLALVEATDGKFQDVKIVVNDLLMNLIPLKSKGLPINKYGRQSTEYARLMNEHYQKGNAIIYFPAGLCSRKIDGEIKDLKWQKNFVQKAIEYKRDIVPVFVEGLNSQLFYNIEVFRKRFNIKLNLGMMLLPRELFRKSKRKESLKMIFGKPITYQELSTTHSVRYWSNEIQQISMSLSKKGNIK